VGHKQRGIPERLGKRIIHPLYEIKQLIEIVLIGKLDLIPGEKLLDVFPCCVLGMKAGGAK
jgi:hypothetical protein